MRAPPPGRLSACRLLVVAALALPAGCGSKSPLDAAGLSGLEPSEGWAKADPASYVVPGRALAAWTGPEGSSLVVVGSLPAPRTDANGLTREMASRLENLPDLRIIKAGTRNVGGVPAAWVEVVAPGTGDRLAPSGLGKAVAPAGRSLIPTHRIAVGFPGLNQTVWLVWHAPESSAPSLASEVETATARLAVRDQPATSSPH